MGVEMLRTPELWWIDLKNFPTVNSPSTQGTDNAFDIVLGYPTDNIGLPWGPTVGFQMKPGYPANSSGQLRSMARQKRASPGSVSSVTFHTGSDVPVLPSGTHFHLLSSGILIDITSPSSTLQPENCSLSSLDLDTLRWQRIAEGLEIFRPEHRWHYCVLNEDGTKAWLLGCCQAPLGQSAVADDNVLGEIMSIDLEEYGFLGNKLLLNSSRARRTNANGYLDPGVFGIGADLVTMFNQPPETGSETDFTITAQADSDYASDIDDSIALSHDRSSPMSALAHHDHATSP
ncbi:hypothetical protein KEM55_003468 [Ascosphaera atra]|nr:hypothetical protein KEM55_003468 [Ascosphaera atra]